MTKINRQLVFEKFGGKCAYCGSELESNWQVDHITPKKHFEWGLVRGDMNDNSNLNPACRKCNHYKRCMPLNTSGYILGFRDYMKKFHIRLSKLPKKTNVERTKQRIAYMQDIASRYGISSNNPFTGVFYFETLNNHNHP